MVKDISIDLLVAVAAKVVVYDPELTVDLPVPMSVASGLNAMAHAMEALWSPERNPVSPLLAEQAVRTPR